MTVQLSYSIDRTSIEVKQSPPLGATSVTTATISHSASSNQLRGLWTADSAALPRSRSEGALSSNTKRKSGLFERTGNKLEAKARRAKAPPQEPDPPAPALDTISDLSAGTSENEALDVQRSKFVEKVSSRILPASLIAFCGKTVAYAFIFCEGIGEILVRQWRLRPETLARVLSETNEEKHVDLKSCSQYVGAGFPSVSRGLSFTSLKSMVRHLRSQPKLPNTAIQIPSNEPWIGRWAGRDTDFFFAFCKSYYDLAAHFLPSTASPSERLCAPGYILLQAQLLTLVDASIQRGDGFSSCTPSPSLQSGDRLGDVDASANILPARAVATRSMAESRVILLLREFLSGPNSAVDPVREMFAESFEILLKAAARRISLFDHDACFSLCDFMEEAVTILARYKTPSTSTSPPLDWSFWLTVCKRMVESQNTMTEIRLYAFLYSMWGTLTGERGCKAELCLGWLLDEKYFQQKFGHWCPVIRAYYMRVLCWRVGRLDNTASKLDG
ncbi:MAG: hypothetical protein Q9174_000548 [Haloplaca sp. 1 TL-2023]